LLSSGEGNPAALREACSSGLPSLVSNVGANADIIQDGLNGFVLDNLTEDEIINRIYDIFSNYKYFSKNSRKIAIEEFSWDKLINNYIKLYKSFIKG